MIEFDPLYKIVSRTFGAFPNRKRQKKVFFFKSRFLLVFCWSAVIREKIWLTVGIRESIPDNDGGISLS
jgi:hypothetical protein